MAYQDYLPECTSHSKAGVREGISRFAIPSSRVRPVLSLRVWCSSTDKLEERDYIQRLMEIGQKEMDCIPFRLLLRVLNCDSDIISKGVGVQIGLIRYVSLSVYSLLHLQLVLVSYNASFTLGNADVQPEWAFANILDQIYEHQSFIKEYLQPLTTKAGYEINVKVSPPLALIFLSCNERQRKRANHSV